MDWLRFMATLMKQIVQSLLFFHEEVASAKASTKRVRSPRRSETEPGKEPEKLFIPSSFSLDL